MCSLYIHIPFCRKKCLYCDFYSIAYEENLASEYVDVLCAQIRQLDSHFSTIYIGGGTPAVLGRELLARLLGGLKRFALLETAGQPLKRKRSLTGFASPEIEFTIEANPESLSKDILELFLESGVNRLSLGVQSFDEDKLKNLGRIHNARVAQEIIHLAQDAGFENISIDLILGVWDETLQDWKQELKKAVRLPIKHISCYALTYEKDTPLFAETQKGVIIPLEDDAAAAMYGYTLDYLEDNGFKQYEVSNFAKEGYCCRHNQNYWENNTYLGLGASSVSYIDGIRKENVSDVREYIARHRRGDTLDVFQEKLSVIERAKETAAIKIRTKEGIDFKWFEQKTGFDFRELEEGALARLTEMGLIGYNRCRPELPCIHLTQKGFLFADIVSSAFL